MSGNKSWYIVDGYRPPVEKGGDPGYKGHESIIILNCNTKDVEVNIDVYFPDKEPVMGIKYKVPAQRVYSFKTHDKEALGGLELGVEQPYSLHITSPEGVVVQYGRLDINQDNMAYMSTMGYAD